MRVLVLGGRGMLGHKLYQSLCEPFDTWASLRGGSHLVARHGFFCPDRVIGNVDAFDLKSVERALDTVRPDAVVNCIGLVKQHEQAVVPELCIEINALFPHRLASLCRSRRVRLVHISTDCVFSGTKGGYVEADVTDAEDLYGRTKALGEVSGPDAITLRTSIIGRELGQALGLVEWFLAASASSGASGDLRDSGALSPMLPLHGATGLLVRNSVKGYTRALFSGLTTIELSRVIAGVLLDHPDLSGIYQISSEPIDKCSLLHLIRESYGFAIEIEPCADVRVDRTLDSTAFRRATGYQPPSWAEMVREMAADPTPYASWRP